MSSKRKYIKELEIAIDYRNKSTGKRTKRRPNLFSLVLPNTDGPIWAIYHVFGISRRVTERDDNCGGI